MTPDTMAGLHGEAFPDRPWSASEFADLLSSKLVHAFFDAEDLGFILLQVIPPEAEILTVVVDASARRQGIAASLLQEVCKHRNELGISKVFLEVADDNNAGLALYQKAGFTVTGRRSGYYARGNSQPVDAVLMQWDL